jgi:hypothetical protein
MTAGRPQKVDPGALYAFAHLFYWDFRRIAEGFTRQRRDRDMFDKLIKEVEKIEISVTPGQRANIDRITEEEIRQRRLKISEKIDFIRSREESQLLANRVDLRERAAELATKLLKVPGEPEIITQLLAAETPTEVREICNDAFAQVNCEIAPGVFRELTLPNWPIPAGSVLPSNLSQYASEFIAARKDPRFPQSNKRPTSRLKQVWFLSRALAGALYGVKTRTAINLVGSKRPEQTFQESRAAKPIRRRAKRSGRAAKRAGMK